MIAKRSAAYAAEWVVGWRRRPLFYAALLFAGVIAITPKYEPVPPVPEGKTLFVGGKIVSEIEQKESFRSLKSQFILNVEKKWDGLEHASQDVKGRMRVSWRDAPEDLRYGDMIVLQGEARAFPGRRNPGGFDSKAYWHRRGVDGAFFADKKSLHKTLARDQGGPLKALALRAKSHLSRRLSRDFDRQQSSFLKALFIGEKSDMDQEFKDLFLKTGTMHMLAVSGFNIGFLSAVLWLLLKPLPLPRRLKLLVLLAGAWAYCLLVGWQSPVVRATIMASVFLLGEIIGRKSDGLNALGLAACVILALHPLELYDLGFQLSFLAVFVIITLGPVFVKRPALLPNEIWTRSEKFQFASSELFWVSFICYFATLPLVLSNFYIVTPYAVAGNFVVVPLSFLLFLFALPYFLVPAVSWLMKAVIAFLVQGLFLIENLPGAAWAVGEPPLWLAIALSAGLAFIFFTKRISSRRARTLAVLLFCANMLLVQEILRLGTRRFEMTMLDVGQGDSIYFEFPEGGNLLIDAGERRFSDKGRWVVAPFLKQKGVRSLDAVLITHAHDDHIGGLFTVLKDFRVKRVYHSGIGHDSQTWNQLGLEIEKERAQTLALRRHARIDGYPGVGIEVLHPSAENSSANPNEQSVVLKIRHGENDFLLTGDIEEAGMRSLLSEGIDLRAELLKVPHHGGREKNAQAFFSAVSPQYSLISAGARNPFKHPAPQTLEALESVPGNAVLRTDLSGAIRVLSDGQLLSVESEIKA